MFTLPDEVKKLIENIIDFVGATPTDDKAVFSIDDSEGSDDNKDDKTSDKKDDSEDGKDNKNNGDDLLS